MEFYYYLIRTYGYNETIVLKDISYKNYSRIWISKAIKQLCEEKKLIRFQKGIYYIPTDTKIGKSKLDPNKVINKQYINDGTQYIGYYSGITFMNMLGLSTQVPNKIEIYTNKEQSKVREIVIGNQRIVLRHARGKVNNDNVAAMSLLELMNFTDAQFYDDSKKKIIIEFIIDHQITRKKIKECSPYFPDKALRTLVESEIIYYVTQ